MKFIVSSTTLLRNLQAISGVLSTSHTLPILEDFLFELNEESLVVTVSDLETTMTVDISLSKAEEPGSITIPAKILMDTLKTFPDIPINFLINLETSAIEISTDEGKFKLSGHKSEDYPKIPEIENSTSLMINSSLLAMGINKTIFATSNDELRPVMLGVFVQLTPENISFVATDAHKLVKYTRKDVKSEKDDSFILPKKALNQLKNILPFEDEAVKVEYNDTNAFFSYKNMNLICRLIDGKYPNYEAVIPTENPNVLKIDRVQLLNSIRRVSIFGNQSTNQIRFKISGRELLLSAEDIDFSNEAKERLTCSYEGEDIEIGFNSKFILEMLNNLEIEEISLEMSTPNRAGILTPVDNENKDEEILMLVMPVMLNA